MKYLVTDPCYIMSDKQWDEYGEKFGWDTDKWPTPIKVEAGTITKISTTRYGDGSKRFAGGIVGVDSGTVCLAEVKDSFSDRFGAFAKSLETARGYFAKAKTI